MKHNHTIITHPSPPRCLHRPPPFFSAVTALVVTAQLHPPPPTNTLSRCQHSCHRDRDAASLLSPPPPTTPRGPRHRIATTSATTTPPRSSLPRRPLHLDFRNAYAAAATCQRRRSTINRNAGGGGYIGCRCRPSCSYARPPTQEEGGETARQPPSSTSNSSLASRQSSYFCPVNFTTSIEMRGDSSDSEDDELEYGYRDSRRRTSYKQRGSSSITPAQIMEQESYYGYAMMAFERSMYFLRLIVLHRAVYASLCLLVGRGV